MTNSLECHVPCPLDIRAVVVENISESRDIAGDGHSTSVEATSEVSGTNCEFSAHVGRGDFSFAETERCSRLTFRLPVKWSAHAEYDGAAHAAKFEERKGSPFAYCLSKL